MFKKTISALLFATIIAVTSTTASVYATDLSDNDDPQAVIVDQQTAQEEQQKNEEVEEEDNEQEEAQLPLAGVSEIVNDTLSNTTSDNKEEKETDNKKKKESKDKNNKKNKKKKDSTDKKEKSNKQKKDKGKDTNKKKTNKKKSVKKKKVKNKKKKKETFTKKVTNKKKKTTEITLVKISKDKFVNVSPYGVLNIRKGPSKKYKVQATLNINKHVKVLANIKNNDYVFIKYKNRKTGKKETGFVFKNYLSNKKKKYSIYSHKSNSSSSSKTVAYTNTWRGTRLNRTNGTVYGPSGKETYYNLPMSGVIRIMNRYGYSYSDYAVRSDGVKTLGGYVMVAANLSVHPRGSLVQTSLGTGLVCDTGGFVTNGSGVSLDIATAW